MEQRAPIKCEVLEELRTTGKIGQRWTVLRIVRWNDKWVNLEKREFYKDKDTGEEMTGKAKGFDLSDLLLVQERFARILNLIKEHSRA